MNIPNFRHALKNRVLFVWDGRLESIAKAEDFASELDGACVHTIYVTPHESICAHGTAGYGFEEPSRLERDLKSTFEKAVSDSVHLRGRPLEIVFGDRFNDVIRLARVIKAKFVLMPKFKQSKFSKWLHGDLNARIKEKANISVVLLDPQIKSERLITKLEITE